MSPFLLVLVIYGVVKFNPFSMSGGSDLHAQIPKEPAVVLIFMEPGHTVSSKYRADLSDGGSDRFILV